MCVPRNGFYLISLLVALLILAIVLGVTLSDTYWSTSVNSGYDLLKTTPLIDGHNDLAWNLRQLSNNQLEDVNLFNVSENEAWLKSNSSHTDIPRLKKGRLGAQFWSAYVSCKAQYKDAVASTLEQIDVIHRFIKKYSDNFGFATSVQEIKEVWKSGKIASLIGVEGGHSIDSRIPVLRLFYDLGVRYLTLTHTCHTPWAESSVADDHPPVVSVAQGLTEFGKEIILEMNRLGMLVDLSHTSEKTQRDVLNVTKAPIIFSHSSAYHLCPISRNVKENILRILTINQGIIMVNFYSGFVQCNSTKNATIDDVVDHINYIRNITGSADYIGIGADYDGVSRMPIGLEDTSKYPDLFDKLLKSEPAWSIEDLKKLAGLNLLRVFEEVEKVKESLSSNEPSQSQLPVEEIPSDAKYCREKPK